MKVRAKFRVASTTHFAGGAVSVNLSPVTTGSEENKTFWKYTPTGSIEMTINGDAAKEFVPNKEFYIDFISVEEE